MNVKDLIDRLAGEMSDASFDLITTSDWVEYFNAAQRQVVLVRPDASPAISTMQMVNGTLQTLPANGIRLLDITRNMGSDGATPGRPVWEADMKTMDLYDSKWHSRTPLTVVKNFILDERTPKNFYVTPPITIVNQQVHIEIKMSVLPTDAVDYDTGVSSIDDIYEGPLRHWMLHLSFAKETDSITSQNTSRFHYKAFYTALGVKTKTDISFSPSKEVESS